MEMIAKVLNDGRQAIVLIPEIALTYQTVMRFYTRFGERVSILNSRMSQGERYDQMERVKKGEVDIMMRWRSADMHQAVEQPHVGVGHFSHHLRNWG